MAINAQARLTFHKNTFFELTTPTRTLFIDPVFSRVRRGRRVAEQLRDCDYVLATSWGPWFDDVLDVLEATDAVFVGPRTLTRVAARELDLPRKRLLDLEPWERASEEGLRITALPLRGSLGFERAIEEGQSLMEDLGGALPRGLSRLPGVRQSLPLFDMGLSTATRAFSTLGSTFLRPLESFGRAGQSMGVDLSSIGAGRPGLAYYFEMDDLPTVLHMADGIHAGTPVEDLEDIADVCEPDVLVMHVHGMDVEPVVRAARILEPGTVLLYRSRDPYAEGMRDQTLPIGSFLAAIEEGAPDVEAMAMRKGESFILEAEKSTATSTTTKSSSSSSTATKASSSFSSSKSASK